MLISCITLTFRRQLCNVKQNNNNDKILSGNNNKMGINSNDEEFVTFNRVQILLNISKYNIWQLIKHFPRFVQCLECEIMSRVNSPTNFKFNGINN